MENFFYNDEFYSELNDLIEHLFDDEEEIALLPEDYFLECNDSSLEPIATLSAEWITERIDDERYPEDGDSIAEKTFKVINENIDFTKINSLLPKLYYPTRKKFKITKSDLLDYLK